MKFLQVGPDGAQLVSQFIPAPERLIIFNPSRPAAACYSLPSPPPPRKTLFAVASLKLPLPQLLLSLHSP